MIKSPCKECSNRKPHCHSTCEEYKEFKIAYGEQAEKIKKNRYNDTVITYGVQRMRRVMEKKKR